MRYLIKEIRRHLWRTIASISGYALAAFFIFLLVSVNAKNENDSSVILKGTGTHFIIYIPSKTSCCVNPNANGSLFADGVYTQMLNLELLDSVNKIKGVRATAPYLLYEVYDNNFQAQISLGGIDTSSIATKNNVCAVTNLVSGKYISDNPNEIIAEESFAVGHHLSIGDSLSIFGSKVILAGIINSGIKPGKADFYSSIENVRRILKDKLHCKSVGFDMNIILVEVADSRLQDNVIKQLKKDMSFFSISSYNCYQPASQVLAIISQTSAIVSILIFIFLIVFSAKTQLNSLIERYREIGILKSLGWSNIRISNQIILTSLIQSIIGVSIGILLGVLTILLMNYFHVRLFDVLEFHLKYKSIPFIIALSLLGGLIASLFPIIKLLRTKAGDMINNYF